MRVSLRSLVSSALLLAAVCAGAQTPVGERPPAVPLITHNPYFSVWSKTDKLTDSRTVHWTLHEQPLTGLVRIDGKAFRIMGTESGDVPALEQTSLKVTPTHTVYSFTGSGVAVTLTFFTPAFLDDLEVLSRPVTYLSWEARSTDGGMHAVEAFLSVSPTLATDNDEQPVTVARHRTAATEVLSAGTTTQAVLNRSGDGVRIDWGYVHLAVPGAENALTSLNSAAGRSFVAGGTLPPADTIGEPLAPYSGAPNLSVALPFGAVGTQPVARHVLVAYTEDYAIQFLHRNLRPYWQRNDLPVADMLDAAERDYPSLEAKGESFDKRLLADFTERDGEHYAYLCSLAYREAIAAHALVADERGRPMLFAKENFSDGNIATVDVLYPSSPIFLFFNPRLLEAQLLPVLEYASLPNHWRFPFAPHDLGEYPLANGQVYGGGETTEEDQMPVEESGNLLIMVDAAARAEGKTDLAEHYWPELTQWAEYLDVHGLDPERQLTTDDFAGHVAHNANLSIKAIDALEAYADLAGLLHHPEAAKRFSREAHTKAGQWMKLAAEGDHYKLAFNSPGTWSQKYNLVWDKVLNYNLFPPAVREAEIRFYQTKLNRYGLPLDSRADYTKLDWEMWTATLADSPETFHALVDPMYQWSNETTSRVPMTDWYDTKTGKQSGFQARSVVGGLFIKALSDPQLTQRWRSKP